MLRYHNHQIAPYREHVQHLFLHFLFLAKSALSTDRLTQILLSTFFQDIWLGLATPNLHHLACQLGVQEKMLGDTVQHAELWVERAIQAAKRSVKFKTTCHPEKVVGGQELVIRALAAARFAHGAPLLSMEELWDLHHKKNQKKASREEDDVIDPEKDQADLHSMRDKGVRCKPAVWNVLRPLFIQYLTNNVQNCAQRDLDIAHLRLGTFKDVFMHRMAMLNGEWCVTCSTYNRQKKSQSYWVMVDYASYNQPGRITKYVRVLLPPNPDTGEIRQLKVALCDFWRRQAPFVDADLGDPIHRFFYTQKPEKSNYLVPLGAIVRPLIHTFNMQEGQRLMLFKGYDHQSGTKQ